MTKRHLLIIGSMIALAGFVGLLLMRFTSDSPAYTPRTMTNQNPMFVVTEFSFTEGTNHVASRGSPLMGRINMFLRKSGRKPVNRALPPVALRTVRDSSVLWVSFKHPNTPLRLAAFLTRPDGATELIWPKTQSPGGMVSGYLAAWVLPAHPTNYPGWWFHIVTVPDGNRCASFEL
jgi:hypothetical protein